MGGVIPGLKQTVPVVPKMDLGSTRTLFVDLEILENPTQNHCNRTDLSTPVYSTGSDKRAMQCSFLRSKGDPDKGVSLMIDILFCTGPGPLFTGGCCLHMNDTLICGWFGWITRPAFSSRPMQT